MGFRLRATPSISADGTRIGIEIESTSRELKQDLTEEQRSRVGVPGFLRDAVFESRLASRFTIRNGGHVLLGSPAPREDAGGRYVQMTLLHARTL